MKYELSLASFFVGLLILVAGIVFVRFYRWVADNFGSGVVSYERYRLYAFITCALGFVVMLNFHTLVLSWIFTMIFRR